MKIKICLGDLNSARSWELIPNMDVVPPCMTAVPNPRMTQTAR